MKSLLRKIEQKLNRMIPQKVEVRFLRANETFNPEQYRAENNFKKTDVILTISLDKD